MTSPARDPHPTHRLRQVDVFTAEPYLGNPVAVVHDADDLSTEAMAAFTRWTNLSECAFLTAPTPEGSAAGADYRVRIFAPDHEMAFAGHPTIGACHAWLAAGGIPGHAGRIVQECGVGLVEIRAHGNRLAFAAPPLRTTQPLDPELLADIVAALGVPASAVVDHRLLDNGAAWHVLLLDSGERVRGLRPQFAALRAAYPDLALGVAGMVAVDTATAGPETGERAGTDDEPALEVRGFALGMGIAEDPVTGSLNASLAQWLIGSGRLPRRYLAAQGSVLGRAGRVYVRSDERGPGGADVGDVWIGGDAVTCIEGTVRL